MIALSTNPIRKEGDRGLLTVSESAHLSGLVTPSQSDNESGTAFTAELQVRPPSHGFRVSREKCC